jgi:site-specific DNA-methyltransferase (adenine-specific)
MKYQILEGDNRDTLKTLPDNSVDAIVTDPPYGIDFLGKSWDANTGALETYQECLRVLKPGGHILAFSAARTYHHLAVTLEQAGFEIRDQIMWIYSSGFPKSQDIGKSIQRSLGVKETKASKGMNAYAEVKDKKGKEKWMNPGNITTDDYPEKKDTVVCTDPEAIQWQGWGTALKPAHEPIALARKPLDKNNSIARNCEQWGTGALNIDATRVPYDGEEPSTWFDQEERTNVGYKLTQGSSSKITSEAKDGRFPSNVIGEIPLYQKYFYCPKVSRNERHIGFDTTDIPTDSSGYQGTSNGGNYLEKKQGIATEASMLADMSGYYIDKQGNETKDGGKNIWLPQTGNIYIHGLKEEYRKWCVVNNKTPTVGNNHPTVKPIELMKYLIKLITPPGGTVLDPFNGSGSTGCAAVALGYEYIGCELDPAYVEISKRRIEEYNKSENNFDALFE